MGIGSKLASPIVAWTCAVLAVGAAVGARLRPEPPPPPAAAVDALATPRAASTLTGGNASPLAAAAGLVADAEPAFPTPPDTLAAPPSTALRPEAAAPELPSPSSAPAAPPAPEAAPAIPAAFTAPEPIAAAPALLTPPAPLPAVVPPAPGRAAAEAADAGADLPALGWPLALAIDGRAVLVHLPQPRSAADDRIEATAVIDIAGDGGGLGVAWLDLRVITDRAAGLVRVTDAGVDRVRSAAAAAPSASVLEQALRAALVRSTPALVLEQVQALAEVARQDEAAAAGVPAPRVIVRQQPSVLVAYDGGPRLAEVAGSDLLRAVNTPFFVVLDPATRIWHLATAEAWYEARDGLGPFHAVTRVPDPVVALARQAGFALPSGDPRSAPAVVVATEPSELLWSDGAATWMAVPGTSLLRLANSPATVFMDPADRRWYALFAGRWSTAPRADGVWSAVPADRLPDDFRRLPPDGATGGALAHVPGTPQAEDAADQAELPQTAEVDRGGAQPPTVVYDGPPVWAPAGPPAVVYAVNTATPVLLVHGRYYTCVDAVWFTSHSAFGGWALCTAVPPVIYTIPASCPVHHVRYVRVYHVGPRFVRYGYTAGYLGCHRARGVVVWGSGHRYQPWTGHGFYVPRPVTYGLAAHHHHGGTWVFGAARACAAPPRPVRVVSTAQPIALHDGGWFGAGGCQPHITRAVIVPATPVYARRHDARVVAPTAPAVTVRSREPRVFVPIKPPQPAAPAPAAPTQAAPGAPAVEARSRPSARATPPTVSTPLATAPATPVAEAPVRAREPRVLVPPKGPAPAAPQPEAVREPRVIAPPRGPAAATPQPAPTPAREPRVFVPPKGPAPAVPQPAPGTVPPPPPGTAPAPPAAAVSSPSGDTAASAPSAGSAPAGASTPPTAIAPSSAAVPAAPAEAAADRTTGRPRPPRVVVPPKAPEPPTAAPPAVTSPQPAPPAVVVRDPPAPRPAPPARAEPRPATPEPTVPREPRVVVPPRAAVADAPAPAPPSTPPAAAPSEPRTPRAWTPRVAPQPAGAEADRPAAGAAREPRLPGPPPKAPPAGERPVSREPSPAVEAPPAPAARPEPPPRTARPEPPPRPIAPRPEPRSAPPPAPVAAPALPGTVPGEEQPAEDPARSRPARKR